MNILEPIQYQDFAEAQKFIQHHACALCLSHLVIDGDEIKCPEHGQTYQHTVIPMSEAEKIDSSVRMASIELDIFGKPKRDPETILKELGF